MAELLIRIVDKGEGVYQSKAGDLIAACPDGWGWGRMEIANPEWAIVRVPGVEPAAFTDMMEGDTDGQNSRKRARRFDMTALASLLPAGARDVTLDDAGRLALLGARRTKPSITPIVVLG